MYAESTPSMILHLHWKQDAKETNQNKLHFINDSASPLGSKMPRKPFLRRKPKEIRKQEERINRKEKEKKK
jgi:hypothetical protein